MRTIVKINSKWIKKLIVKKEAIELVNKKYKCNLYM